MFLLTANPVKPSNPQSVSSCFHYFLTSQPCLSVTFCLEPITSYWSCKFFLKRATSTHSHFFYKGLNNFPEQLRAVVLVKVAQTWVIVWKQTKRNRTVNVFSDGPRRWFTCGFRRLDKTQTRRLWCSKFDKKSSFIAFSADTGCAAHYLVKIKYLSNCTLLFKCVCIHSSKGELFTLIPLHPSDSSASVCAWFHVTLVDILFRRYVTCMRYVLFKCMKQHMSTLRLCRCDKKKAISREI